MRATGKLKDVGYRNLKGFILADAAISDTLIGVSRLEDFDESGQVSINGVVYLYESKDDVLDLMTLAAPGLTAAVVVDDEVFYYPISVEKTALVDTGDEDWQLATLDHALQEMLEIGVRENGLEESVVIDDESGEWKLVEILGEDVQFNGLSVRPGTVPNSPDGEVPPQVTGLVAAPGIKSVFLTWTPVINFNVTWYNIYGSDETGVPTDASHFLGRTSTNRFTAYEVWDSDIPGMTTLSPGEIDPDTQTYTPNYAYFKVEAEDADGAGTASSEVFNEPATINSPDIAVGAIIAEHLRANSVEADKLEATLIHAGEQYIGLIHTHPTEGITIPQIGSEEVTHFAADGTGSQFAGGIVANDGLTSYGGVNMQGTDNFLAGELKGGSGVNNPSNAPSVSSAYDTVNTDAGGGFYRKGLSLWDNGTVLMTTDTLTGSGESNVQGWVASGAGGPAFVGFDILAGWSSLGGVTRLGSYYYVLCRQHALPTNWRILIYNATTEAYVTSFDTNPLAGISISTSAYPAIGHDGTNLCIAWVSAGVLYCRRIKAYGVAGAGDQTGNTLNGGAWSASHHIAGVQQVAGYMYISGVSSTAIMGWTIGSTTLTRNTAKDFPKNVGAITGFVHDGTTWATFNSGKKFTKHTANEGQWDFGHDWTDADTGGSGIAYTMLSPLRRVTPVKFAKWIVTVPSFPPDDLTTDGANTARIFAGPVGGSIVFQHQLVTNGDGITGKPLSLSKTFDIMQTTGAAPNASNDFSSRANQAIGRFSSTKADGSNPMWNLDGDGAVKLGKFVKGNADGSNAYDSGWTTITPASGYEDAGRTVQIRAINGHVRIRGNIQKTTGSFAASAATTIGTIADNGGASPSPTRIRPPGIVEFQLSGNSAPLDVRCQVSSAGVIQIITGASVPAYVTLDTISYYNS